MSDLAKSRSYVISVEGSVFLLVAQHTETEEVTIEWLNYRDDGGPTDLPSDVPICNFEDVIRWAFTHGFRPA
jgi:hypothetical protein